VINGIFTWLQIIELIYLTARDAQAYRRRRANAGWTTRREILDARLRLGEIDSTAHATELTLLGPPPRAL
jgi:hypothetical protein